MIYLKIWFICRQHLHIHSFVPDEFYILLNHFVCCMHQTKLNLNGILSNFTKYLHFFCTNIYDIKYIIIWNTIIVPEVIGITTTQLQWSDIWTVMWNLYSSSSWNMLIVVCSVYFLWIKFPLQQQTFCERSSIGVNNCIRQCAYQCTRIHTQGNNH